jgi:uncharacterized membrane protein YbhN (UPF0104 family)
MSKNKFIYILLSFVVSALLIWFLLSQIETEDFIQTFSRIHYPALFAYMAIALIGAGFRAWRYRWLLHPHYITWGNIWLVTLIRNLFVDLFPARIGSLSYIYILNKRLNFSFEAATSTFVIAVIFDFITLSPFLIMSIFAVGFSSTPISFSSLLFFSLVFFIVICLFLWKITQIFSYLLKAVKFLLKVFRIESQKWAEVTIEKIQSTKDHLFQIKKRKIFWPLFSLSFFIRLAKYGSVYFLLLSLLRSYGFTPKNLSVWKMILGSAGANITSFFPVKGIAGFGTWETAWALTFKLMNFEPRLAILSGFGVHLITNIFEYSLGIIAILILAIPFLKKVKKENKH